MQPQSGARCCPAPARSWSRRVGRRGSIADRGLQLDRWSTSRKRPPKGRRETNQNGAQACQAMVSVCLLCHAPNNCCHAITHGDSVGIPGYIEANGFARIGRIPMFSLLISRPLHSVMAALHALGRHFYGLFDIVHEATRDRAFRAACTNVRHRARPPRSQARGPGPGRLHRRGGVIERRAARPAHTGRGVATSSLAAPALRRKQRARPDKPALHAPTPSAARPLLGALHFPARLL